MCKKPIAPEDELVTEGELPDTGELYIAIKNELAKTNTILDEIKTLCAKAEDKPSPPPNPTTTRDGSGGRKPPPPPNEDITEGKKK